eukprot:IDg20994t1
MRSNAFCVAMRFVHTRLRGLDITSYFGNRPFQSGARGGERGRRGIGVSRALSAYGISCSVPRYVRTGGQSGCVCGDELHGVNGGVPL